MITVLRQTIIVCEVERVTEDETWAALAQGRKPPARGPPGCGLQVGSPSRTVEV